MLGPLRMIMIKNQAPRYWVPGVYIGCQAADGHSCEPNQAVNVLPRLRQLIIRKIREGR